MVKILLKNAVGVALKVEDDQGVVWWLIYKAAIGWRNWPCCCEYPALWYVYRDEKGKTKCRNCLFEGKAGVETDETVTAETAEAVETVETPEAVEA